jgi:hypothetical protein
MWWPTIRLISDKFVTQHVSSVLCETQNMQKCALAVVFTLFWKDNFVSFQIIKPELYITLWVCCCWCAIESSDLDWMLLSSTFIGIVPCYCLHNKTTIKWQVLCCCTLPPLICTRFAKIAQGEIRSQCMWTNIPRSGKRYAVFLGGRDSIFRADVYETKEATG